MLRQLFNQIRHQRGLRFRAGFTPQLTRRGRLLLIQLWESLCHRPRPFRHIHRCRALGISLPSEDHETRLTSSAVSSSWTKDCIQNYAALRLGSSKPTSDYVAYLQYTHGSTPSPLPSPNTCLRLRFSRHVPQPFSLCRSTPLSHPISADEISWSDSFARMNVRQWAKLAQFQSRRASDRTVEEPGTEESLGEDLLWHNIRFELVCGE